jgi:hypothetical protein
MCLPGCKTARYHSGSHVDMSAMLHGDSMYTRRYCIARERRVCHCPGSASTKVLRAKSAECITGSISVYLYLMRCSMHTPFSIATPCGASAAGVAQRCASAVSGRFTDCATAVPSTQCAPQALPATIAPRARLLSRGVSRRRPGPSQIAFITTSHLYLCHCHLLAAARASASSCVRQPWLSEVGPADCVPCVL